MYNTTGDPYDLGESPPNERIFFSVVACQPHTPHTYSDELGCLKPVIDDTHRCPPEAAELIELLPKKSYLGNWVTNCTATLELDGLEI